MPQEMLESAASSAMPQSGSTNAREADIIQLIKMLGEAGSSMSGSAGPMTTMQPTMGQPSMPPQYQMPTAQVAQGPFGSVGERSRADAQANINNLANLTKSLTDFMHQKKVREYSTTIEKVMGAQSGMTEAQSMLEQAQQAVKANPQDTAAIAQMQRAQDALGQNREILSTLGSDPKVVKILEKAFSVKLIGDDKKQATPEYQALQMAIRNKDQAAKKEAGLKMMEKFQKTQPVRQQLSPQYLAMAQLIKDKVLPEANKQLEYRQEVLKQLGEATRKQWDVESKEKIAGLMVGAKDRQTQGMILSHVLQEQGRVGAAEIMARASRYRADKMSEAMMQDTQWRMAGEVLKAREGASGAKAQSQLFNNLSKEHQRITDEIKDAQNVLKGLGTTDEHWYQKPSTNQKVKDTQSKLDSLRQQQQTIIQKMGQLNFGGGTGATGSQSSSGVTEQDSGFAEFDRFFESLLEDKSNSSESGDSR